ncbi:hypothetical protein DPMN_123430 [Dreissena polymorpha]|uniref:Uncharacterized protein n=1 Tax=Dreissena polymorpha TaxID=45954 RepID=A0A9D4GQV4_DREPO|nr:hypothetical protein DPMN_123430 [Dreissena polymorpha]
MISFIQISLVLIFSAAEAAPSLVWGSLRGYAGDEIENLHLTEEVYEEEDNALSMSKDPTDNLAILAGAGNRILKAFAKGLDPDKTPQNVASHQDPNYLLL